MVPILILLLSLAALVALLSYICYRMAFYAAPRKPLGEDEFPLPDGEIYESYRDVMIQWVKEIRTWPHEDVSVTSFDGLTLRGKLYEYAPGAPIELMLHGYRGAAEKDMCGGVRRCFAVKRSALVVDQRACGTSDGSTITFGVNERRDCLSWVDYTVKRWPDRKIILTGISMGAATVVMAAGEPLPENVIGVLADCGYTTAKEMIQKTIAEMRLPPKLAYPFVKLGAKLYGHFDLEETSPIEALKTCKVPVIFFHGEADDFVPCDMSRRMHAACPTRSSLITVPGAGHGLAYPVDKEGYIRNLMDFFGPEASAQ